MDMIQIQQVKFTSEMLNLIAEIDEFKGAWKALSQLQPEQLTALKRVATIESVGSSTRIEGSTLSDREVEALLSNLAIEKFETRDQQEVAGYSGVMNIIFENFNQIPLSENYILQLHRDLLRYSEKDEWHRGQFKKSPNYVEAFSPEGKSLGIIFETATPFETPHRMNELVAWVERAFEEKEIHVLLIVSVFVVVFLAIHPFQDGNGRLSRVLTTYLLLRAGYAYVPYSSLEAVVEQNKEGYYRALRQTQATLKSDTINWQPWFLFFLKALQQQKQKLASKLENEKLLYGKLPALSLQIVALIKSRGRITNSEIVTLTEANRNTVKKHLEKLVVAKILAQHGTRKSTWYTLSG